MSKLDLKATVDMGKAMKAKDEGNAQFRRGHYVEAKRFYDEALELAGVNATTRRLMPNEAEDAPVRRSRDRDRAVFYSNRAACSFELGDYESSLADASACLKLLRNLDLGGEQADEVETIEALRNKNLLRSARASFYAAPSEGVDLGAVERPLRELLSSCSDEKFSKLGEKMLKQLRYYHDLQRQSQKRKAAGMDDEKETLGASSASAGASSRPGAITDTCPILRSCLRDPTSEKFTFGHDRAMSALQGDPNVAPDKETDRSSHRVRLGSLSPVEREHFAILFGGVGDCRHVFATILDLHHQIGALTPQEKNATFRIHITLNDINASVVAKSVLYLIVLSKLGSYPSLSSIDTDGEAAQLAMLMQYLYLGFVMPPDLYESLCEIMDGLLSLSFESFSAAFPWMQLSSAADWNRVTDVLSIWASGGEGCEGWPTVLQVLEECRGDEMGSEDLVLPSRSLKARKIKDMTDYENWSDRLMETVARVVSHAGLEANRSVMVDTALKMTTGSDSQNVEEIFARETGAILPPKDTAGAPVHSAFVKARDAERLSSFKPAQRVIVESWNVNPTFFDPFFFELYDAQYFVSPFNPTQDFYQNFHDNIIIDSMPEPPPLAVPCETFAFTSRFFWNVGFALTRLTRNNTLHFELNVSDILVFCRAIQDYPDDRESKGLPSKFYRMFGSNIPDYTGLLSIFTECMPVLWEPTPTVSTYFQCNVLMNTQIWNGDHAQYVYSSTAIPELDEVSSLLGIQLCSRENNVWHEHQWAWSKFSTKKTTREQLILWLHRLYLSIILPSERSHPRKKAKSMREECPYNTSMFLRACAFCVEVLNYPSHWVASVLDEILRSSATEKMLFKTKAQISTVSPNVFRAETQENRVNLSAFQCELGTQLALMMNIRSLYLRPLVTGRLPSSPIHCYSLASCFIKRIIPYDSVLAGHGLVQARALGFLLERREPDGIIDDTTILPEFSILSAQRLGRSPIRSAVMNNKVESLLIYSCLQWHLSVKDKTKQTMYFWMSDADFSRYKSYYVTLIRTDDWCRLSSRAIQLKQAKRVL